MERWDRVRKGKQTVVTVGSFSFIDFHLAIGLLLIFINNMTDPNGISTTDWLYKYVRTCMMAANPSGAHVHGCG